MITTNLKRFYDPTFAVTDQYKESLPDLQNGPASLIEGANVPIQQVGISNFKLPLKYPTPSGELLTLETSVDGYVGLEADKKGINMGRIMRTFYKFQDDVFHPDKLEEVLLAYKEDLESQTAFLKLSLNYPMLKESLRSDYEGYQYYRVSIEGKVDEYNRFTSHMHLDFEYSSACPCSYELSEHARETRDIAAIPHSQRSVASLTVQLNREMFIDDLVEICREALQTETQVIVKREDEQAFAEMNGAFQKFVEDAARLLYDELNKEERIRDFVVRCAHLESLHSHDAVSRICKGVPNGLR
ncbi:GTP cyclohydrolase FolE2 [Rhodohalobacter sulfatireducens]|uniref:GTP cyclohydrolase FolE2 n=1 Tax=Rhodohalobacter sulfatireducens TaxID=2911366 RepID=A0ABS9KBQ3_9BACT|nr:GTP cyclohydrolase FolE2 [Rhodohalobacter sulfatireducens]MCG2588283.1 GTP cyclohydrolase FolE2 [Rhodohalobacter sulfatireducens]